MSAYRDVEDILDALGDTAVAAEHVRVGEMVEAVGGRGYGPLLFVPAMIELSPLGGIPGVPTVLATVVALFAVQIVLGRRHLWLPRVLERIKVPARRLRQALDALRPAARWLDRWFHGRLRPLTGRVGQRAAATVCFALCLTVPPLEIVPFASSAPMAAVALFGLAITLRDGLVMALAFTAAGGAFAFGAWLLYVT